MMMADGKVDEKEELLFAKEMVRFGVREEKLVGFMADAQTIPPIEAISIVKNIGNNEKKYVAAFLGTLMVVDGHIDDAEMKLWKYVSILANLPVMNVTEAIQIMSEL